MTSPLAYAVYARENNDNSGQPLAGGSCHQDEMMNFLTLYQI